MAVGNKRYSHFSAQKHETIGQNIGGICYVVPPTNYWGDIVPPVSTPMIASMPSSKRSGNVTTS